MTATLEKFDMTGRSALVTGAASGIGLAQAEALAEAGAKVSLTGINLENAEREAKRMRRCGWDVRADRMDVSEYDEVVAAMDAHVEAYGSLDACFANAGVDAGPGYWDATNQKRIPAGEIENMDLRDWDRVIQVNLTGAMYTMREAVRVMKAAKTRGSIVATTSNSSTRLFPVVGTGYMAAKAGLRHLVQSLALELAEYGIRVNAIAPGSFVTNISGGVLKDPAVRAAWASGVPLGDMAETHEIKPLALYLASEASAFVTGTEMYIDGGVQLGQIR